MTRWTCGPPLPQFRPKDCGSGIAPIVPLTASAAHSCDIRMRIGSIGTERVWPAAPNARARNPAGHELVEGERLFLGAPKQRKINPPGEGYNGQLRRLPA